MAEWKTLGEMVPRDLWNAAIDTRGLLVVVSTARMKLKVWLLLVGVIQRLSAGNPVIDAPRADIGDNPVAFVARALPPVPSADLDRADAELARIGALHARAGRSFVLYGRGVGLEGDDAASASLQEAEFHHNDARYDAAAALRRLRAAAAMARAFEDAVRAARTVPCDSPEFDAWMKAARKLASHAVVTCSMVLEPVRRMRASVCEELHHVWTVVHGPYEQLPGTGRT